MKYACRSLALIALMTAQGAWGASALLSANVEQLLTNSGTFYGGCMVRLDTNIATAGLDCPGAWISFSCSGDFASTQDAKRNFEMAQLAFALDKEILVRVLDDQTHNGQCFANRVDLVR
jgi:hypothetical protein